MPSFKGAGQYFTSRAFPETRLSRTCRRITGQDQIPRPSLLINVLRRETDTVTAHGSLGIVVVLLDRADLGGLPARKDLSVSCFLIIPCGHRAEDDNADTLHIEVASTGTIPLPEVSWAFWWQSA